MSNEQITGFEGQNDALTEKVIGCAIKVHRELGPGLFEATYEQCLSIELASAGMSFKTQQSIPIVYKGKSLETTFRADLVVENRVIVEVKAIDDILAIHQAQLLTYLKLSKLKVGLLINFNSYLLRSGLRRLYI